MYCDVIIYLYKLHKAQGGVLSGINYKDAAMVGRGRKFVFFFFCNSFNQPTKQLKMNFRNRVYCKINGMLQYKKYSVHFLTPLTRIE